MALLKEAVTYYRSIGMKGHGQHDRQRHLRPRSPETPLAPHNSWDLVAMIRDMIVHCVEHAVRQHPDST